MLIFRFSRINKTLPMRPVLWTLAMLIQGLAFGQSWKSAPFSVGILNNATLLPPASLTAVFNEPIHPGLALTYEFGWKETIRSPMFRNIDTHALGGKQVYTGKLFQNAGISWYYHRNVNHALLLTTQGGYRRYFGKFSAEASVHIGYMHAFLLTEQAVRQNDGTWTMKRASRPQFVAGAGIGAGYDAGYHYNVRRIFINYDFRLQMPFVKEYVSLLPNGILTIGLQFTLFKNNSIQNKPKPDRLECPTS